MAGAAGARGDVYIDYVDWRTADGSRDALDFEEGVILGVSGQIDVGDRLMNEKGQSSPCVAGSVLSHEGVVGEGGDGRARVQLCLLQGGDLDPMAAEEVLQFRPGGLDSPSIPLHERIVVWLRVCRYSAVGGRGWV